MVPTTALVWGVGVSWRSRAAHCRACPQVVEACLTLRPFTGGLVELSVLHMYVQVGLVEMHLVPVVWTVHVAKLAGGPHHASLMLTD